MPYTPPSRILKEKVGLIAPQFTSSTKDAPKCVSHKHHTGTAVIAFRFKDGIVVAADTHTFTDTKIYNRTSEKILQLRKNTALGVAGLVAWKQYITRLFGELLSVLELRAEINLPPSRQLQLFHHFLQALWAATGFDYLYTEFIFAGVDESGKSTLAVLDGSGDLINRDDFAAIGCGGDDAKTVIEQHSEDHDLGELSRSAALTLGAKSILVAAEHNAFVGHPLVDPPFIACITKEGFVRVPKETVQKIVKRITS